MDELIMAIDEAGFRKVMSFFPSGVTVVTTEFEGERAGMTVSAFSSLSLSPPLCLICIEKSTRMHELIPRAERFAVNILAAGQEAISNQFASRIPDRFDGVALRDGKLRLPLLEDAMANIECRLHATLPGGDHTIFVGEVVAVDLREGDALLYYRSAYRRIE